MKVINCINLLVAFCLLLSCKPQPNPPFTKLVFHTSVCFGSCPAYHLEVKADKTFKLYAETVFKPNKDNMFAKDTAKEGYFTGKVADSTFKKLCIQVEQVGLDTMKFNNVTCCDAPLKKLIAYYNGKRKTFISMFPPKHARPLLGTLQEICANSAVKKSGKFEIEEAVRD